MFDDTSSDGQYRDRVHAYHTMIAGLARKALGTVCKDSPKANKASRIDRSRPNDAAAGPSSRQGVPGTQAPSKLSSD